MKENGLADAQTQGKEQGAQKVVGDVPGLCKEKDIEGEQEPIEGTESTKEKKPFSAEFH